MKSGLCTLYRHSMKTLFPEVIKTSKHMRVMDSAKKFEDAWNNPNNTQVTLRDVDINDMIQKYYETDKPLVYTKTMLWDMEAKKAWDPATYVPDIIKEKHAWGRKKTGENTEEFVRSILQRQWMHPDVFKTCFEEVYLDHQKQIAYFIGASEVLDSQNKKIYTNNDQPLFYVEHSVKGSSENKPVNSWRIVHITEKYDLKIIERSKNFDYTDHLPKFVEIHIEYDLGIQIKHRNVLNEKNKVRI